MMYGSGTSDYQLDVNVWFRPTDIHQSVYIILAYSGYILTSYSYII